MLSEFYLKILEKNELFYKIAILLEKISVVFSELIAEFGHFSMSSISLEKIN